MTHFGLPQSGVSYSQIQDFQLSLADKAIAELSAENERLRAVLEQYADTANWVGHEWRGPTTNGWVLAARAL